MSGCPLSFSGTGDGFRKFCDGDIDIQNASRPIEHDEIEQCLANGVDYYEFEIAYDGITVVVNPENDFVDLPDGRAARTALASGGQRRYLGRSRSRLAG